MVAEKLRDEISTFRLDPSASRHWYIGPARRIPPADFIERRCSFADLFVLEARKAQPQARAAPPEAEMRNWIVAEAMNGASLVGADFRPAGMLVLLPALAVRSCCPAGAYCLTESGWRGLASPA